MQHSDRISNIVLVVGIICATIIILAFREPPTKFVMQRTDGQQADGEDKPLLAFPQEAPHQMRKRVAG